MTAPTPEDMQAAFEKALATMDEFSTGQAPVQKAARKIARALEDLKVPYTVAGGSPSRRTGSSGRRSMSI